MSDKAARVSQTLPVGLRYTAAMASGAQDVNTDQASPATPDALGGTAAADRRRAADLARMRAVATGLLGLMAVVFVLASLAADRWPGFLYLRAFAEAGMVGACADWFAVTALFRRPFNLPIPHTGIIPRSKDRIGEALGGFIADNFLTVEVLDGKLRQLELARWGAHWMRQPANAARLARRLVAALPQLLDLSPVEARRELLAAAAAAAIRATPAAPLAASVLQGLWSDGRAQPILDRGLDLVASYLTTHETLIRAQVRDRVPAWIPGWVDRKIADRVVKSLAEIVEEMRAPAHPWRVELQTAVTTFIARLETDPELRARGEAFKAALLDDPRFLGHLDQMRADLEARVRSLAGERGEPVAAALARAIVGFGEWLDSDANTRAILNAWARAAARRIIAPQRHDIGRFIAQVVAGWDTRSVVEKLELQVGRDLQYIRINGTLVGGLVGLLIFTASRLTGLD